ncbi:extracellular solute-binding protein [Meridianimarinicoccus sp. RP-17]|uniref:extracellular solute-binding protein n=1 Tax=Meridianimarinicoccus zhengii TaxID=2056810 RepID=UPI000DACAB9E|nr:extracellular solute-binding protein [Phycocomes zhengii]
MTRIARLCGRTALGAALAAAPAFAADPDLLILDWSGYEEDPYWAQYAEHHGTSPTYSFFGDESEAFQKLRSGFRADVAHPCPQSVAKWRAAGLIEPWDIDRIPSYANVAEAYRTDPVFTADGDVWFIPADLGATAIAWNTAEVDPAAVDSLQVFTDPAFAGRISLPDNADDAFALGLLATGVTDWTTMTEADLDAAAEWLRQVHPNVRTYWTDGAELAQLMATGEVLIAWSWNETPVQLSADGHPIAFQRDAAEGSSMWFCGYVNLVDGPGSEDKAHDFMESFLQPEVAEYIVNEWGYGHGNAAAMNAIPADTLDAVGLGTTTTPVLQQVPMDIRMRERMIAVFERIKTGF